MAERDHDCMGENVTEDHLILATKDEIGQMKIHLKTMENRLKDPFPTSGYKRRHERQIKKFRGVIKDAEGKKPVPINWKESFYIAARPVQPVCTDTTIPTKYQHKGCRRKSLQGFISEVRRARVLIINNEFAEHPNKRKIRHGCQHDYDMALKVFIKQFGYENFIETVINSDGDLREKLINADPENIVDIDSIHHSSWTLEQMKILVEGAVTTAFNGDAIIIIIDTHGQSEGERTVLFGEDSKKTYTDYFLNLLHDKNCHDSVKGKLKLLTVQACRGSNELQYNVVNDDAPSVGESNTQLDVAGDNLQQNEAEDNNEIAQSSSYCPQQNSTIGDIDNIGEPEATSNTEQVSSANTQLGIQQNEAAHINDIDKSCSNGPQQNTAVDDIDEIHEPESTSNTEQATLACSNTQPDNTSNKGHANEADLSSPMTSQPYQATSVRSKADDQEGNTNNQQQYSAVQCSDQDDERLQNVDSIETSSVATGVQELSIGEPSSMEGGVNKMSPFGVMPDATGDTARDQLQFGRNKIIQPGASGDISTSNANPIAQQPSSIIVQVSDLDNAQSFETAADSNEVSESTQSASQLTDTACGQEHLDRSANIAVRAEIDTGGEELFSSLRTEHPPSNIVSPLPSLSEYIPDILLPISCPKHCIVLYSTPFPYLSARMVGAAGDEGSVVLQTFLSHLEECLQLHGEDGVPLLQVITAVTGLVVRDELEMPETVHRLVKLPVFFRKQ